MATEQGTDTVAKALQAELEHAVVGGIKVRSAKVERTVNFSGDEVYHVALGVDDPDGPTWSVDDLTKMDLLANRVAAEAGASEYVYVQLTAARDNDETATGDL